MKKTFAKSLIAALVLSAAPAFAAPAAIEAAKAQCIVGEQTDGYLGIIDSAKADEALRREVRDRCIAAAKSNP